VTLISELVKKHSEKCLVRADILAAVVLQESGGKQWSSRFEPTFYEKYLANKERKDLQGYVPKVLPTLATEKVHRATSWGLCHILGETARSQLGFTREDLVELLDPDINVGLAAQYLQFLYSLFPSVYGDDRWLFAVRRYNGKGPRAEAYGNSVFDHIAKGNHRRFLD
jgi:hypothetical protein